jgi:hypothetical protein
MRRTDVASANTRKIEIARWRTRALAAELQVAELADRLARQRNQD